MDNGLGGGGGGITALVRLQNCTLSIPEARSRCFLHISNQPCTNANGLSGVYSVPSPVSSSRSCLENALVLRFSVTESLSFLLNAANLLNHLLISLASFWLLYCKRGELRRQEGQKLTEQTREKKTQRNQKTK